MALAGAALSATATAALNVVGIAGTVIAASEVVLALTFTLSLLVACGGLVCLYRDARVAAGKVSLFALSATRMPRPGLLSRLGLRFLLGPAPRPGDVVRVRTDRKAHV